VLTFVFNLITTKVWMMSFKIDYYIFLQNLSSRLQLYLYFPIHIYSFNYQIVSKTLWYTYKAHRILFLSDIHLGLTYITFCSFIVLPWCQTISIKKQQLLNKQPRWSLNKLSNSTIWRTHRHSSLSAFSPHHLTKLTFTTDVQLCLLRTCAQHTVQTPFSSSQ